ncbi:MAG: haloacid dehalogenase-like hydrolase [Candidatus Gracilibacteria bacterium]|nr:haloacid dehalogenase-like hydrolase [Candidatus Gracilibacteria bacterium]MDD2908886.1 haloacid dehalogenase-like hydrolase [Candidatus Gracilibacteria bacterium]
MQTLFSDPEIHIKDRKTVEEKITNFRLENLQIVADFDSTITQDNGHTSWSLFSKSGLMSGEYCKERDSYFDFYYPYEIDATLTFEKKDKLMREWWQKHLELFIKYKLNISVIDIIIQDNSFFDFRYGMEEFLELSVIKNIPFIILSAGLTNTINEFLTFWEVNFFNVHVVSNELKFDEEGFCIGINKDVIIHSENKDEHDMPAHIKELVSGKKDIILLGDSLGDVKMIDENLRKNALKIGFISEKKMSSKDKFMDNFDIVIESNDDSFGVPEMILDLIK